MFSKLSSKGPILGIPDLRRFGDTSSLPTGIPLEWVVQEHDADRAGKHFDVRFGRSGHGPTLFSWATRKELPKPKEKTLLFQQPLHRGSYADFEGVLPTGYGKGTVKTKDRGKLVVTEADKSKIKLTLLHKDHPEEFVLVRQTGAKNRKHGGDWLLINTTPTKLDTFLGLPTPGNIKATKIPSEKVESLFDPKLSVTEKIDGARVLYKLLDDRVEAIRYRPGSKQPIELQTHRLFGPAGARLKVPEELRGTVFAGHAVAEQAGKTLPASDVDKLLTRSVLDSWEQQRRKKIKIRNMLLDIIKLGKEPVYFTTKEEKEKQLRQLFKILPKNRFFTGLY